MTLERAVLAPASRPSRAHGALAAAVRPPTVVPACARLALAIGDDAGSASRRRGPACDVLSGVTFQSFAAAAPTAALALGTAELAGAFAESSLHYDPPKVGRDIALVHVRAKPGDAVMLAPLGVTPRRGLRLAAEARERAVRVSAWRSARTATGRSTSGAT